MDFEGDVHTMSDQSQWHSLQAKASQSLEQFYDSWCHSKPPTPSPLPVDYVTPNLADEVHVTLIPYNVLSINFQTIWPQ